MKKVNSSPERHTFQSKKYTQRLLDDPNDENAKNMLELFESMKKRDKENLSNPTWKKDNLEYDLRSTDWIIEKVKNSKVYAQHLYAAMCNNDFMKNDVWPRLTDKRWHCSWRYAGGIIADMREEGDYIDWYCSGIRSNGPLDDEEYNCLTKEQQEQYIESKNYVNESHVTDEIREDMLKLGWIVIDD